MVLICQPRGLGTRGDRSWVELAAGAVKLVLCMLADLFLLFMALAGVTTASANALFEAGRYRDAAFAYLELLRNAPRDSELLHKEGLCFLRLGAPKQAAPFFQREVEVSPMNVEAMRLLAETAEATGMFAEAHDALEKLTELAPADPDNFVHLGRLLYRNGYYSGAAAVFGKVLARNSESLAPAVKNECEVLRAIALEQGGNPAAAGRLIPALLNRPQNKANLDLLLAHVHVLYEQGEYENALGQVDATLQIRDANATAHFWKARVLQQMARYDAATIEAERSVALEPGSPAPHNLLVRLYSRTGRAKDAAREAEWLRTHENAAEGGH